MVKENVMEKLAGEMTVKVTGKKSKKYVPKYSLAEELVNSISHGVGAGLAVAALVLCVVKAEKASMEVAVCLYGTFMIILYTISCIYHALGRNTGGKKVLRVIDHANVFLMEAGTYMPVCVLLGGALGWVVFGVVWAVTILAVVLTCVNVEKYWLVGVFCNLLLGWGSLLLLGSLIEKTGAGVWWLIGGGVAYSVGAALYVMGARRKWFHSIFHFFVLLGSILQFFFIYFCCL
ncbi:hemolysin III family protein [Candidatus Saccharibacteria bacterium]|nr:hemolysin III family protein [Candidatus Saccharibacteria bacterium]